MASTTILDIANALGISRNTVSKVINGKGGVLPETSKKIIEAAISMGYTKIGADTQRLAGIIQKDPVEHKGYIAIVTSEPDNYFWMGIINGVSRMVTNSGYGMLYVILNEDQIRSGLLPSNLLHSSVDGIIVANLYDPGMLQTISRRPIPKVYYDMPVDASIEELRGDVVFTECRTYTRSLVRMLAAKGRKRFGFIGDTTTALSINERWSGFKEGLQDCGLELLPEFCFTEDHILHFYSDKTVTNLLNKMQDRPDAFICANDSIGLRVITYYGSVGISIPDAMAVTGFDGIPESMLVEPHLTTVRVDNEAVGRRLARQLLWRIENREEPLETVRVSAVIAVRSST